MTALIFVIPLGRRILFSALLVLLGMIPLEAKPIQVVIQSDPHLQTARKLVAAALEASGVEVEFVDAPLANEKRQLFMLEAGQSDIDLMPVTGERLASVAAGKSLVIPVPLDRGLLGYRLCLLLKKRKDLLAGVQSAQDLRAFTIGQGEGWMDVDVYKNAHIPVKWVRDWRNGEFVDQMNAGFIDLFPLGAEETLSYFIPHYQITQPEITSDPSIVIRYPWYRFVWISAASKNAELLRRALQEGFVTLTRNGQFLKIWAAACRDLPESFFSGRTVIDLPNPLYGPEIVGPEFRTLLQYPPRESQP